MATIARWKPYVNRRIVDDPAAAQALAPAHVEQTCRQLGYAWRESFWSPATTILTCLLQVLSAEKTLRAAVAALLVHLTARGQTDLSSPYPSAYCQARRCLPAGVLSGLCRHVAGRIETGVQGDLRWHGHPVKPVDGTTNSMPDTPDLQQAFPQPKTQKPGCGFPMARLMVLFCWATGAVLQCAIGNLHISEISLLRQFWSTWLKAGDVLLADRHYCSYVDLVRLQAMRVFGVFRLNGRRKADFRKGKRLGRDDQRVTWPRPAQWHASFGVTREQFEQLPETLHVRLIRISDVPRRFPSRTIVVVTTLLDPLAYPADEIRALFGDRWTAELNLRSLKITLGMDVLRGQTPDVVRKEILMHLLVYNLIRLVMWQAAARHGRDLHRLSFAGTLHRLRAGMPLLMVLTYRRADLMDHLLAWIASDELPDRPDRVEPRCKKRRPKEYSWLMKPRSWYHVHGDHGMRSLHAIRDCAGRAGYDLLQARSQREAVDLPRHDDNVYRGSLISGRTLIHCRAMQRSLS